MPLSREITTSNQVLTLGGAESHQTFAMNQMKNQQFNLQNSSLESSSFASKENVIDFPLMPHKKSFHQFNIPSQSDLFG
jgi:hypothetical protein